MPTANCTRNCWITAAVTGLLVWLFSAGFGPLRWFEGLFLALVAAGVLGVFLIWLTCRGEPAISGAEWEAISRPDSPAAVNPARASVAVPRPPVAALDEASPAKGGQPDDLKVIKGVGPKLEDLLHQHGVTRFAQIAAWNDAEIDRFAELIGRMGGRIRSDDWVGQARALAANGQDDGGLS